MAIQSKHQKVSFIVIFSLLIVFSGRAIAETQQKPAAEVKSGLKTNYSKINISNLPIGQTISMTEVANAPMIVGNNYNVPVYVEVRTESPKKPRDGYAVIPDPAWIVVEPNGLTVGANSSMQVDVKVSIPDDEKLYGNKYVCKMVVHTGGDPNQKNLRFGAQVAGFFMFSIAPGRNDEALAAALKNPADAAYAIEPPVVVLLDAKPGQKIDLRAPGKKKIELINNSKKTQKYFLYSVNPNDTQYQLLDKSRFAGKVEDVSIRHDQIKLGSGKKKALDITIQVPKDVEMLEEALTYMVSITSGTKEGVVRYLVIYLGGPAQKQNDTEVKEVTGPTRLVTPESEPEKK
ncbi:hypothetical protein K8S19_12485 [bacterium]|nr:hypothetical protein [bacterium]